MIIELLNIAGEIQNLIKFEIESIDKWIAELIDDQNAKNLNDPAFQKLWNSLPIDLSFQNVSEEANLKLVSAIKNKFNNFQENFMKFSEKLMKIMHDWELKLNNNIQVLDAENSTQQILHWAERRTNKIHIFDQITEKIKETIEMTNGIFFESCETGSINNKIYCFGIYNKF